MTISCIAVDDEPLALGLMVKFIEQTEFLHLKGTYSSAIEALKELPQMKPELVFIDIQMPDLNGMELAKILLVNQLHLRIIFTTAFHQFALEGYRVNALDYLLKPFNYEEFQRAAEKARDYFELIGNGHTPSVTDDQFLFLKVETHWVKVAFADILYIESLKDYVKVYLQGDQKPIIALSTLKSLEEKLPTKQFLRLHRSYIISLDKISTITKTSVQIGDASISISDQYKDAFRLFLQKWVG